MCRQRKISETNVPDRLSKVPAQLSCKRRSAAVHNLGGERCELGGARIFLNAFVVSQSEISNAILSFKGVFNFFTCLWWCSYFIISVFQTNSVSNFLKKVCLCETFERLFVK
ncbi:hypothetical protein L596_020013 [Steinernema carpocapsae]|uniref:Uncharacterized protein n=1 Tax=Steinernema carpocapsae TaxID=34508 RepID=A0A4U5MSX6_STECR|nr:hypothetical protein L596_020013 [Steinernema carpocapsae]